MLDAGRGGAARREKSRCRLCVLRACGAARRPPHSHPSHGAYGGWRVSSSTLRDGGAASGVRRVSRAPRGGRRSAIARAESPRDNFPGLFRYARAIACVARRAVRVLPSAEIAATPRARTGSFQKIPERACCRWWTYSGWIPCSRQYSSQHALPVWIPAWPMWMEMTSRMVVGGGLGKDDGVDDRANYGVLGRESRLKRKKEDASPLNSPRVT